MNKHTIIGNLVRDVEKGTTPNGVNYARFTVAVRKRFHKEGEPDAEFVRVTAWRGLGDTCAKYLSKGKKVAVTGESLARGWSHEGKTYAQIELTAEDVEFLTPRGSGEEAPPEGGMTAVADADLPEGWT